jgi:putative glutamine transport system substrate-binding protein
MGRFLLVGILLTLLLTGCSEMEGVVGLFKAPETAESLPSAFITSTPETVFPASMSTAARILARGEIVVGVRYDLEPFSYITEASEVAGLEVDLARELARRWLGNPDAVRFRQVRSDSAFQHLKNGTVDIVLAGVGQTQEMESQADFSPPYFVNGMALLTFPDTGIQSIADLGNHNVGVVDWTGSGAKVQAAAQVSATITEYPHFLKVVDALRLRQMDVYADERHRLERARRLVTGSTIVGQFTSEPVALVFREDDSFFYNLVKLTFQDMAADGSLNALYARWLPTTPPPQPGLLPGAAPAPAMNQSPAQLSTLDMPARIRQRGTLAVGYFTDRWPYSGDRADGVPTGFEVRLLERIAERWLGDRQAITFIPVTEADAFARLQQGEVDLLAGNWVASRETELQADFSIPILDDGVSIFSLAGAPMENLAALNGKAVGVVAGSAGEAALPGVSQAAGVAVSPVRYPDFASALDGMRQGAVGALVTERRPALDVHFREAGYFITDERYTSRPVVFIIPEGDSSFRDLLNFTLGALQTNGVYAELYSLWFDDAVYHLSLPPGQPAVPLLIPAN